MAITHWFTVGLTRVGVVVGVIAAVYFGWIPEDWPIVIFWGVASYAALSVVRWLVFAVWEHLQERAVLHRFHQLTSDRPKRDAALIALWVFRGGDYFNGDPLIGSPRWCGDGVYRRFRGVLMRCTQEEWGEFLTRKEEWRNHLVGVAAEPGAAADGGRNPGSSCDYGSQRGRRC
jgi:hypothetical protein